MDAKLVKSGLIGALALAAGAYVAAHIPDPAEIRGAMFVHPARIGEPVALRTGLVKLVQIDASNRIFVPKETAFTGANVGISQHGIFLVVTLDIEGRDAPAAFADLSIEDRKGRTFGGAQAIGTNACGNAPPGLPVRCQLIFEMDKEALEGARLNIPASTARGDDMAQIDLGIDAAKAATLARNTQSIRIVTSAPSWGAPL